MLTATTYRIEEMARVIKSVQQHAHDQKFRLLCTSTVSGNAWLREYAKLQGDIRSLSACTILELAVELADPWLTTQQLRLISPAEQEALVSQVWHALEPTLTARTRNVIGSGIGYVRVLQATIQELRLAGIDSATLDPEVFPVKERGRVLQAVLERYELALAESKAADPATVMTMARDRLIEMGMLPEVHLLVPQELKLTGLSQSVLDQIPMENYSVLKPAELTADEPGEFSDIERLAWLAQPQDAPAARKDGTVTLYRALSPEYEARVVLGTILREAIPFDHVEVLYSDEAVYPELFYSLLAFVQPKEQGRLPFTLGAGVPISWTRPGRAVRFWLDWVESQFQRRGLVELLVQNLIELPAGVTGDEVLQQLQSAPDCTGAQAWQRYLHKRLEQRDLKIESRTGIKALLTLMNLHFQLVPDSGQYSATAWKAVETLLSSQVKVVDGWDEQAQKAGLMLVRELQAGAYTSATAVWERMRQWATVAHLPCERDRPGCLHLSPIHAQASARRPYTFCVGLSDESFPSLPARESLLTDRERKGISPELAMHSMREMMHQQNLSFQTLLGQLQGNVTFSYSCADQVDDREQFPSQLFMQIFRLTAGLPEGDLHELESWLQAPLGPASSLCRMTNTEDWLNHLPDRPYHDAIFRQQFPLLCRGVFAVKQRRSYLFTEYDGAVPAAGGQFDLSRSNPVFSAHSLQQYARCPLQFFYQHVLKIHATEAMESDPGRWLHPLVRGVILHTVFHRFHVQLQKEKRSPNKLSDMTVLRQMLQEAINEYEDALPLVSPHMRQAELNELHETLNIFLGEETQWAEKYAPRYFETGIGTKNNDVSTVLDSTQPIGIPLPSGRSLPVQGRIDRIDEVLRNGESGQSAPTYFVWDYKTGRMKDYQGESVRRTGQLLQPLLYLEIVEKRLREVVDSRAVVSGAGYFFPGQRGGQGDRLIWQADDLRRDKKVLDTLLDLLQAGVFLATDNADVCKTCDYSHACELSDVNKQAEQKQKHYPNAALRALNQLRKSP